MQAVWSVLSQKAACTHEEINNERELSLIVRRHNKLRILSCVLKMSKAFSVIVWAEPVPPPVVQVGRPFVSLAAWNTIALLYQRPKFEGI